MIIINGLEMPKENEQLDIVIHPDGKVCYCLDLECKQIATAELVNKDIEYEIDELINPEAYDNYWDENDEYTNEAVPVKHGRWIKSEKSDYNWECSNCGYGLTDYRTTYCYDCGAKMDLDEAKE